MSLHWTEDQYRAYVTKGQPAPVNEAAFQAAVVRLAKQYGFMAYHTHNSKRSPEGFPDLVLAKAGAPLLCIELKTDTGQVTSAQQAWVETLTGTTGVVAEVWRPRDLEDIIERLRGMAR